MYIGILAWQLSADRKICSAGYLSPILFSYSYDLIALPRSMSFLAMCHMCLVLALIMQEYGLVYLGRSLCVWIVLSGSS